MTKITTNTKEQALTESRSLRDEAINNGGSFDFLDKLKAIQYLTKDMILSKKAFKMIFDYLKDNFQMTWV